MLVFSAFATDEAPTPLRKHYPIPLDLEFLKTANDQKILDYAVREARLLLTFDQKVAFYAKLKKLILQLGRGTQKQYIELLQTEGITLSPLYQVLREQEARYHRLYIAISRKTR